MPSIRKLYTLQEVKDVLAKKNKVDPKNVRTFNGQTLHSVDIGGAPYDLEKDSYIFQVDME
jgi:hypothetical protein